MKKCNIWLELISCLIICLYSILIFLSKEAAIRMTREDGIVEITSAICYFISGCLLIDLFIRSRSLKKRYFLKTGRNYFYLLLGILFFVFCGEELSWGQRIFGFKTPDFIQDINYQGEVNIHNLRIFQGVDSENNIKTGLKLWLTGNRLFALFWLFLCFLIPLFCTISSRVAGWFRKISFPVMPLWIGILFILNHLISMVLLKMNLFPSNVPVEEIKETNFALLFLVVSTSLFLINKKTHHSSLLTYHSNNADLINSH